MAMFIKFEKNDTTRGYPCYFRVRNRRKRSANSSKLGIYCRILFWQCHALDKPRVQRRFYGVERKTAYKRSPKIRAKSANRKLGGGKNRLYLSVRERRHWNAETEYCPDSFASKSAEKKPRRQKFKRTSDENVKHDIYTEWVRDARLNIIEAPLTETYVRRFVNATGRQKKKRREKEKKEKDRTNRNFPAFVRVSAKIPDSKPIRS